MRHLNIRLLAWAWFGAALVAAPSPAQKPKFASEVLRKEKPSVEVDVDISGARRLFLVVTDGGDGYGCDWADWAEPRLIGARGETRLTELEWQSAGADWGKVHVNKNAGGGPLRIAGKPVDYGIGTHANSIIAYTLPANAGYTRFRARAGLDNGGTDQGGGSTVQFLVYTEKPPEAVFKQSGEWSHEPADAIAGLDIADGLEATLFASEPMIASPANIDVDHLGRVWVCEIINYRRFRNTDTPERKEGDRILVLEDTDGDGKADKNTVFYQGRDIDSPHGVCVLGHRVIVSAGANVFVFTDKDGDLKADDKQVLFTGIDGVQHDHGIHAFVFGPDGKLYFNFGNEGRRLKDAAGKPVVDRSGRVVEVSGPYREGMVFRCDLDGSNVETLGWNFRNNWEVAVDSFGTLWQSDNDDDGNRGVRINYVMEFGNYGYKDERTGAGWRDERTGIEEDIPTRHWHQNDPGVIPNLLQTGAGSPTGICVYEGRLLPKVFWDQVIHCDAGPNVVRAYPVKPSGAGYSAEMVNILHGARDNWFRPADVCVAPDGALFVSDWYDPGVGGHRAADLNRGRIYRVAPPGVKPSVPPFDFTTAAGAATALMSPNQAARHLAWMALHQFGKDAEPVLKPLFEKSDDSRLRARALGILAKSDASKLYIHRALTDQDSDIRITALRLARQSEREIAPTVAKLIEDPVPQVRRECALALRHSQSPEAPELLARLARQHDGKDRWYLEAIGIGAEGRWDAVLDAWLKLVGDDRNTPAGRDIIWRSRAERTPELLATIINDSAIPAVDLPRYLRAFDFQAPSSVQPVLVKLGLERGHFIDPRDRFIALESVKRLSPATLAADAPQRAGLLRLLGEIGGTPEFVEFVARFGVSNRHGELLALAQKSPESALAGDAMRALLADNAKLVRDALAHKDVKIAGSTVVALGTAADGRTRDLLLPVIDDAARSLEIRQQAVRALAQTRNGAQALLSRAQQKKLDESLSFVTAAALHSVSWKDIRDQSAKLFPLPPGKDNQPVPFVTDLLTMKGNVQHGKALFAKAGDCAKCHQVGTEGKEVGPNLSEIGGKLSRQALFESILFPSAGISHNYESTTLALVDGNIVTGIVTSETGDAVTIKNAEGISRVYKKSDIETNQKSKLSLMPADLHKNLTPQDIVDIVEYLTTLKKS